MPRESAETKGLRYLVEHRITILSVDEEGVRAIARGSGEVYQLGRDASGWHCTCPCRTEACSHLFALKAVVVVSRRAHA